ncbi:MAG: S8 family serine peptidase, partial [Candidatus Altiarchaeota archaeon]|nr:S8 family serine peptidase [Candidatus Altiarchaeota archaeon]
YSSGTCSESTSLDQVTCFSNRCSILDVWAPGSKITAPSYLGANWFVTMSGTSQAAPHVAGAAALIQQYAKLLNGSILPPARVKAALVATGKSITRDVTKPRIDVFKAVRYFNFQAPRATAGVYPSDGNPSTLFNFTLNYTDLDNSAPSYVRVNIDGINYTMKQASSSVDYYNRVTYYFNTTLSGGTHSYNFSASDGGYINRTTTQTLQVSTSPTLSNPQVTPASGITSTVFNYTVVYTDEDNGTPTYVYAVVDGTNHNMSGNSTDYDAGVLYHYATTLSAGTHNYFFNASDGTYRNQTALVSGSPTVNAEPSLSNPQVNPTVGPTNTLFNYTVVYTDAGNEAPTQKNLILDGTTYSMQGTGTTYSAGVTYYYNKTLSAGTHNYRFSFSDGLYTVLTTTTSNPKVYSTTPSCDGAPTNQPNWIVNTYTNCTSTAVLPTSTLRGYLNITGGYTLNLTNTKIYLNNTRLYLDGKLILKDSEFDFII